MSFILCEMFSRISSIKWYQTKMGIVDWKINLYFYNFFSFIFFIGDSQKIFQISKDAHKSEKKIEEQKWLKNRWFRKGKKRKEGLQ